VLEPLLLAMLAQILLWATLQGQWKIFTIIMIGWGTPIAQLQRNFL
tara:strand:- start:429 stop:566 length:138 start_codon:yes stop_codon:yes gene_type:complete